MAGVVSGILETIDNAPEDWETGGDAMRWNPPPLRPILIPRLTLIEAVALSPLASAW